MPVSRFSRFLFASSLSIFCPFFGPLVAAARGGAKKETKNADVKISLNIHFSASYRSFFFHIVHNTVTILRCTVKRAWSALLVLRSDL